MRKSTTALVGLGAAVILALTSCSTKSESGGSGDDGEGGLKTDIGVTDDTITLGVLYDASGPYKSGGLSALYGHQIWADEVNDNGGICGRQIEFDIKDHGYKAENAVPLYEEMRSNDLGLVQLLGSPTLAAVKTKLSQDKMLAGVPSMASNNLDNDQILATTTTYDVEMINGLSWMMEQGMLSEGDTIGAIYLNNEAGQNGIAGTKYFAEQHDITIIESEVGATDADMTSTVTKMKSDGVKLMAAMVSPAQVSSIGVQMKAQGMDMPLLGWGPTYAPTLVTSEEVVDALTDNYYLTASAAPWMTDTPEAQKVRDAWDEMDIEDPPSSTAFVGYLAALAWGAILEAACDSGDMTREGVMEARKTVDDLDTGGLSGTLDFSNPNAPTTREVYIAQLAADIPGGTQAVSDLYVSDDAKEYKAPYE
ncbi:ABC transporter substrate-binding protein [Cumulibacter soli]|uniref:ABC transporter substrate-binding protein n=1 Tax=Cumulibacter soli TaxID=2546344 RepID=UPI001067AC2E|nr:ABC transporter substrate-binding protein [Cumulibacter soli]